MNHKYRNLVLGIFLVGALGAVAPGARADTIYTYTGNSFNSFAGADACNAGVGVCGITASFTVASPLTANFGLASIAPLAYSISDGQSTITSLGSLTNLFISTDATGALSTWQFQAQIAFLSITTENLGGTVIDSSAFSPGTNYGQLSDSPGTWTMSSSSPSAVPEPGTWALLGTGALLLLGLAWRRCGATGYTGV